MAQGTCSVEGCERPAKTRGWCQMHYVRFWRHGDPGEAVLLRASTPLDLLAGLLEIETDACVLWPAGKSNKQYGYAVVAGVSRAVHVLACEHHHGPRPTPRHQAAHAPVICHNPSCVNGRHLSWKLPVENMADQLLDGTRRAGDQHYACKITQEGIARLKVLRAEGWSYKDLADEFGIGLARVSQLVTGWVDPRRTQSSETC